MLFCWKMWYIITLRRRLSVSTFIPQASVFLVSSSLAFYPAPSQKKGNTTLSKRRETFFPLVDHDGKILLVMPNIPEYSRVAGVMHHKVKTGIVEKVNGEYVVLWYLLSRNTTPCIKMWDFFSLTLFLVGWINFGDFRHDKPPRILGWVMTKGPVRGILIWRLSLDSQLFSLLGFVLVWWVKGGIGVKAGLSDWWNK